MSGFSLRLELISEMKTVGKRGQEGSRGLHVTFHRQINGL